MDPVLCFITHRKSLASPQALIARVADAARAGVHLIQVREPDLEGRELGALVRECVRVVAGTRARVIVNDRLDVAIAAGAAGVHLREASFSPEAVRRMAPRGFLVGRSLHDVEDVARVRSSSGCDYIVLGPVFDTASKPSVAPMGLATLSRAIATTPVPILALGGVTAANAGDAARAGAAGIAAIGLWTAAPIAETARAVTLAFRAVACRDGGACR